MSVTQMTRTEIEQLVKESRKKGQTLDLGGVDFSKLDLRGLNLSGANLRRANLFRTDLSRTNLCEVNFMRASLSGANLTGASLIKTDIRGADLSGAALYRANLSEAMMGWTSMVDTDLSATKGLDTIKHLGPSEIGIRTLYRSGGGIPETFLRGVGVPETFITYLPSLIGQPIQYYSCFISYSSQHEDFAQRLHADLQQKGVRCWFAPEDMKIGDKIRPAIDQSIRIHDKLLVILSENSIQSDWVEDEAETAIEEEKKRGETVLFPIRLDKAVMDTDQAWAAKLRRTRHIGDFSRWKDHDAYQEALERLLRDLKSEG